MSGYQILLLMAICLLAGLVGGWRVTVWHYGFEADKVAIAQVSQTQKGEIKLVKDTNAIHTVIIHEKPTDCGNAAPPAAITSSLR